MSESVPSPQHPEPSSSTVTLTETVDEQDHAVPRVTVKLKKPRTDRKVQWSTETVDNEHLGRKKSKCCCIYKKPRPFGESSSSDSSDDECEHCQGHIEKKKKKRDVEHQTQKTNENSVTVTVDPPNDSSSGEPAKGPNN